MEESGKTPFLPVSSECPEETYFFRKKPNPDIICINLNNLFFTFPDIGGGGKMEADARHDFTATADDELSFCKGDVLKVSGEGQTLGRHMIWYMRKLLDGFTSASGFGIQVNILNLSGLG